MNKDKRGNFVSLTSIEYLKRYPFILLGLWFIGAVILILWSINLSDDHLMYTLDDPYIHLAVAGNILQGGYGVNLSEYSAPSSSIIYPFLLVITEWAGLGGWGPLLINILAMACAVYVVGNIIKDYVITSNKQVNGYAYSKVFSISLGLLVCLVLNGWGLVMTGMEHSLHVLSVVLILLGFLRSLDVDSKVPVWLIAAIVTLPLIRFEGLAMALLSVIALIYLQHRRAAFFAASLILLSLFGWFLFTQSMGLPVLPSSVLLKSGIAANMDRHSGFTQLFWSILRNIFHSMNERQGILLLLSIIMTGSLSYKIWKKGNRQISFVIGGLAVFTGLGHVFFGHYGWFSRYEIYSYAVVIISGLVLGRAYLVHTTVKIGVILALLLVSVPYAFDTFRTPLASRNIYQQQYQMHRFAVEYWKRPVAVNDLGWVSYNNPNFILDLWGLGSEEVRRMKFTGIFNAQALDALVLRRHVSLVMIYDNWFNGIIPTTWRRVAVLNTSQVTAASGKVAFYVTSNADRQEVIDLLNQFKKTLPKGASLNVE